MVIFTALIDEKEKGVNGCIYKMELQFNNQAYSKVDSLWFKISFNTIESQLFLHT